MTANRPAVFTAAALALAAAAAAPAGTETITLTRDVPDLDRWNYAFNAEPGVRDVGSTFGAVLIEGFDDHDAQFLVGFDTDAAPSRGGPAGIVPAGLGESRYEIVSATLTLTIGDAGLAEFDGDYDPWTTYLTPDDPDFTPDADDPGDFRRPVMLFGTGYRNGYGLEEGETFFTESEFFGAAGFPVQSVRSAFATDNAGGVRRDVSNNVKERFEIFPFAIGQASTPSGDPLAEGDVLSVEDNVTFEIDLSNPDAVDYLRWSLDRGYLSFSATALHVAFGGPKGGEGVSYPVFFTKEDALAPALGQAPRLELVVNILPEIPADLNGDGVVGTGDLGILLAAWGSTNADADLDGSGTVGTGDLGILLAAWG